MRLILLAAAFLIVPLPALAQDITVSNAYSYATPESAKNGAVFLTVANAGDAEDWVVGAATAVSGSAELHTHKMDEGVMMMRQVHSYDLPAGGTLMLEPMGNHIMLMGLHAPLQAGETFPLTLKFEVHEDITVDVPVMPPGQKPE